MKRSIRDSQDLFKILVAPSIGHSLLGAWIDRQQHSAAQPSVIVSRWKCENCSHEFEVVLGEGKWITTLGKRVDVPAKESPRVKLAQDQSVARSISMFSFRKRSCHWCLDVV